VGRVELASMRALGKKTERKKRKRERERERERARGLGKGSKGLQVERAEARLDERHFRPPSAEQKKAARRHESDRCKWPPSPGPLGSRLGWDRDLRLGLVGLGGAARAGLSLNISSR
jgi:hypothetical protein